MMQVISQSDELRAELHSWRQASQKVAFVPTMGNLHAGHLRLVEHARSLADRVVVSIFVNPLQFGQGKDFTNYPRTLEQDKAQLIELNTDLLFTPNEADLYPAGREQASRVVVPGLNAILCGQFRPGHFDGVATVVTKLFNLVQPDIAVFGKKDYQQLLLIQRLVRDLGLPIQVVGLDTVREADGLAMSSRNGFLGSDQRQHAVLLYQALSALADKVKAGAQSYPELQQQAISALEAAGFDVDYVEVRRRSDLGEPQPNDRELVALVAARIGATRLIDNVEIKR